MTAFIQQVETRDCMTDGATVATLFGLWTALLRSSFKSYHPYFVYFGTSGAMFMSAVELAAHCPSGMG